ncbi:hypothetical protein TREES_T100007483 [Tupaia chinensis]|uniref:Uncharacterized protein n=1 Tax=Tupaia chinensis TaxID=246437 RepID=L9KZH0_TUPCH|nr:hypothetical protein TREES_T100007483 [Tupaia chinensis]
MPCLVGSRVQAAGVRARGWQVDKGPRRPWRESAWEKPAALAKGDGGHFGTPASFIPTTVAPKTRRIVHRDLRSARTGPTIRANAHRCPSKRASRSLHLCLCLCLSHTRARTHTSPLLFLCSLLAGLSSTQGLSLTALGTQARSSLAGAWRSASGVPDSSARLLQLLLSLPADPGAERQTGALGTGCLASARKPVAARFGLVQPAGAPRHISPRPPSYYVTTASLRPPAPQEDRGETRGESRGGCGQS